MTALPRCECGCGEALVCVCGWWIVLGDEAMHKHAERMRRSK